MLLHTADKLIVCEWYSVHVSPISSRTLRGVSASCEGRDSSIMHYLKHTHTHMHMHSMAAYAVIYLFPLTLEDVSPPAQAK